MAANIRSSSSSRNQTKSRKRRRGRKRLLILGAVGAVILLFLLAILVDSTLYLGKIHAGVTVSGIELGGMAPKKAKAALEARVQEAQKSRVTLTSGNKTWTVAPKDVGVTIDAAATVGSAMDASRKGNFLANRFRGFLMYFKHKDVPLQGTVSTAKLDQFIAEVAQSVDVPPMNAGLVFDGQKIKIVKGQKGRVVDQKALESRLKTLLLSLHATKIEVPMAVQGPTVLADNFDQALQPPAFHRW